MGEYRAFILGEDGHVREGYEFEGASDEAAVQVARQLSNRHGVEVWQLDRKVAVLEADRVPSAAST
jgi:hypothetical protein